MCRCDQQHLLTVVVCVTFVSYMFLCKLRSISGLDIDALQLYPSLCHIYDVTATSSLFRRIDHSEPRYAQ